VPGFFVGTATIAYHPAMHGMWKKLGWAWAEVCAGVVGSALWWAGVGRGDGLAFVGWVGLVLIFGTIFGVIAGLRHQKAAASAALLAAVLALEVAAFGLAAGFVGLAAAAELVTIVIAWTLLWSAAACALRRFGSGIACGAPLFTAMLLLASPVAAMPLVHACPSGSWRQTLLVKAIAHGCPILPCLDAVKPAIRIQWAELPGMYAMSGLGQEVPMELPNGWCSMAIYGGGGIVIWGLGTLLNRKRP
jgi:hypothetical protein